MLPKSINKNLNLIKSFKKPLNLLNNNFYKKREFSNIIITKKFHEKSLNFNKFNKINYNQQRTMKTVDFGGTKEKVYERNDYPKEIIHQMFNNDTIAVIGYGVQGRAQSLNMRDNGLENIIIGLRPNGKSWQLAKNDGWIEGKNLLPIEEACEKGSIIMYLLSDAGQKESWPLIEKHLTTGKTLYFSHGFSVVYKDRTKVIPPKDIDVILVAPKGSGTTVRSLFLQGRGINSSVAVFQDVSGHAKER